MQSNINEIDVLDREKFLSDVQSFIELLADKKKSATFAIDGRWGVGKTFVLTKLEERLKLIQCEETNDDKYFVFHYDCWKYDYYDEPAIAIASVLKEIEVKDNQVGKFVMAELEKITGEFLKGKIGINPIEFYQALKSEYGSELSNIQKFDDLYSFKTALESVRESIRNISSKRTILFVVDELDRCLPEYAIKVLERLHHFFNGIDNVVVIISVDKGQLENTVKHIYGQATDVDAYLKKFITFTIELDEGIVQNQIYNQYNSLFPELDGSELLLRTLQELFEKTELPIRSIKQILDKIELIHQIQSIPFPLPNTELFEVLWGIMRTIFPNGNFGDIMRRLAEPYRRPGIDDEVFPGKSYIIQQRDKMVKTYANSELTDYAYMANTSWGIAFFLINRMYDCQKPIDLVNTNQDEQYLAFGEEFVKIGNMIW